MSNRIEILKDFFESKEIQNESMGRATVSFLQSHLSPNENKQINAIKKENSKITFDMLDIETKGKLLNEINPNIENGKIIAEFMYMNEEKDKNIKVLEEKVKNLNILIDNKDTKIKELDNLNQKYKSKTHEMNLKLKSQFKEANNMKEKYESLLKVNQEEKETLANKVTELTKRLEEEENKYELLLNAYNSLKEEKHNEKEEQQNDNNDNNTNEIKVNEPIKENQIMQLLPNQTIKEEENEENKKESSDNIELLLKYMSIKHQLSHSIEIKDFIREIKYYLDYIMLSLSSNYKLLPFPLSFLNDFLMEMYYQLYYNSNVNNKEIFSDENVTATAKEIYDKGIFSFFINDKEINDDIESKYSQLLSEHKTQIDEMIAKYNEESILSLHNILSNVSKTIQDDSIIFKQNKVYEFNKTSIYSVINSKSIEIDLSKVNIDSLSYNIMQIRYILQKEKHLTKIKFTNNFTNIPDDYIQMIFTHFGSLFTISHFEKVSFTNLQLTSILSDNILSLIESFAYIQDLSLINVQLSYNILTKLIQSLIKTQRKLRKLNLSNNKLNISIIKELISYLQSPQCPQSLIIEKTELSDKALITLLNIFKDMNVKLKKLGLGKNTFSSNGFYHFSNFFEYNPNIEYIDLSFCPIDYDSCFDLGINLFKAHNIKIFNFSSMNIEGEMVSLILNREFNGEELIFDNNNLGDLGILAIAQIIKTNDTLKKLYLRNCNISLFAMGLLFNDIEENKNIQLREIFLEENDFNREQIEKIVSFGNNMSNIKIYISKSNFEEISNGTIEKCDNLFLI